MVIEDEKPILGAIKLKLGKSGFRVLDATTVSGGFNILEKEEVSAIWLDHYLLGKENGLDFVAGLKHDESPNRRQKRVNRRGQDVVVVVLRVGHVFRP